MVKTLSSFFLGLLLLMGVSAGTSSAQALVVTGTLNAGVVNGKAVSLPRPEYPAELRDAGIEGIVVVDVIIGEDGTVVSAAAELNDQRIRKDADGNTLEPAVADPQLRASAEAAARQAKFAPTMIDNTPVTVRGKLVYNFVAKTTGNNSDAGPRMINGGVLNGKATTLPLPDYPAAAKAVNAGGAVSIQVLVDEGGNVVNATAISGHPLLRSAAEAAALGAKFSPTLLSGVPVRISGVLTYNFVP